MHPLTTNSDLRWPLKGFDKPKSASDFLASLNGALPVYSATVKKIYTEYRAEVFTDQEPLLVIQPDMTQFAAMFSFINPDSVMRTSVFIYTDREGLCLSGVLASCDARKSFRLKEGLYRLFAGEFIDGAFLPIITYGDLRTLPNTSKPILQLHGLRLEGLASLSSFQINDIVTTIKTNLIERLS